MKRRWLLILLAGLFIVAVPIAISLFSPISEHWRTTSPDGAFIVIAHTQPIYSLIGVMPGQGSDKPGRVTVYRGNQSCGSAWVPMVSFAYDLRWELDTKPRRAEIRFGATWNLDDCAIEYVFGG
ncbi:MAG TPA: hypothetical protein VFB68_15140 [Xanthobacteraceae bacterium]|nr:hypothetical protein [Xanthobacteraceae bacterium]